MKFKKPKFWDSKKPNILAILLLPFTIILTINNFLINSSKKNKSKNVKTICVGNIYVGGTGKTPTVIKLHEILKNQNFNMSVGKKFYKSHVDERRILDSKTNLITAKSRDEILKIAEKNKKDLVIFDDGLQEKKIDYDLKLVCFDSEKWIGNGLLIPSGPLRENLISLNKYNAVLIKQDMDDSLNENIIDKIKKINPQIKIFNTYYKPINLQDFDLSKKFLIFSGIGNPDSFKRILQKNNFNIVGENIYPDHFKYSQEDINKLLKKAKQINAEVITTEKDYFKISKADQDKIKCLKVNLEITNEREFLNFLIKNVN